MSFRYLFGPVTAHFAEQNLHAARASGVCLAFNPEGDVDLRVGPEDSWEDVVARLPDGWRPDAVVLDLAYTSVAGCLWSAPAPLIGLAGDWNLLWHHYRRALPLCELVLTDTEGVDVMARQGITHARAANLYGCERVYLEGDWPQGPRDIDVLFVGNLNPVVQRERMPWLARLAALAGRWRVAIRTGVHGADYRALLARSRVVFNRSIRGESNLRTFEAAAAGALLFQEAGNREVPAYFQDRQDCVYYTDDDFESQLDYYLTHEDERRAIAERGRERVRGYSFAALWAEAAARAERELPALQERAGRRPALGGVTALLARTWQALGANRGKDPALAADLATALKAAPDNADLHNALGLITALAGPHAGPEADASAQEAARHFHRAVSADPRRPVAALNLVESLVRLGRTQPAIDGSRHILALLQRSRFTPETMEAGHYPPAFDPFRVEWERAAWRNAGRPAAEARAKSELLYWRLHTILGDLTGDVIHYHEAALARPDLPLTCALLGCALGRAGRPAEAVTHLWHAVAANPLDAAAARALFQALRDSGDAEGASRLAGERLLLHRVAPQCVPLEAWFAEPRPSANGRTAPASPAGQSTTQGRAGALRPRVSLCLIVKNEEENLPACLSSVADLVGEIVVVDTGSADRTKEIAARFGANVHDFPWVDDFAAARNEALKRATGQWILWLDADDRLDEDNRKKLRDLFGRLKDENAAYVMKCLCLPERASGAATVVDHVRLFHNRPDVRWEYRVHEQILPAIRRTGGDVHWSDVIIHHIGYQDPALRSRKLERDLRLLRLEDADRPDDPFTLFNLGSVFHELGRSGEALPVLRRSLAKSQPKDSIVRKLYALIVQCHRARGEAAEAAAACREGRRVCPDDAELLFLEGNLRREQGDLEGAKACLQEVLESEPEPHFASVDAGLRGYKARHNLAVILHQQGLGKEAESQWRLVIAERPDFLPGWLGLGEAALKHGNWGLLDEAAARLEALPGGPPEAAVLRGRGLLSRRDFAAARALLEGAAARFPQELAPRVLLTHVLLQGGRDLGAAEGALRAVLALAPNHAEARHNLDLLLREKQRRSRDAAFLDNVALAQMYEAACRTPSDINEHLPTLYALARECRHVTEFGAGVGAATAALLYAQPDRLACYDRMKYPPVDRLAQAAGRTEFVFHEKDVLWVEIEETDLLFIDTWHVYEQLKEELRRHASKVRKYIVLHDTTTFGEQGEAEGHKGLWPAVEEFLTQGTFRLKQRYTNNNGLTVLEAM